MKVRLCFNGDSNVSTVELLLGVLAAAAPLIGLHWSVAGDADRAAMSVVILPVSLAFIWLKRLQPFRPDDAAPSNTATRDGIFWTAPHR